MHRHRPVSTLTHTLSLTHATHRSWRSLKPPPAPSRFSSYSHTKEQCEPLKRRTRDCDAEAEVAPVRACPACCSCRCCTRFGAPSSRFHSCRRHVSASHQCGAQTRSGTDTPTYVMHVQSPAWKSPGGPRASSAPDALPPPAAPLALSGRAVLQRLHAVRRAKLMFAHLEQAQPGSIESCTLPQTYTALSELVVQAVETLALVGETHPGFGHCQSPSTTCGPAPRPPPRPPRPPIMTRLITWQANPKCR